MDESYGDHSDSNCYSDHSLTGSPAFLDDGKTSSSFFFIRAYPESGHFYPRHPGSLLRTSEALPLELPDDCSLVRSCFEMFAAVIHRDFSRQFQLLKREHSSSYVTASKSLLLFCWSYLCGLAFFSTKELWLTQSNPPDTPSSGTG